MEINIQSPIFEKMLSDLNGEIQRVIDQVHNEEFEAGEITLKLNLTLPYAFKEFPREDENGEMINELYKYKQPRFEHKVTTTLKKQFKREGLYLDDKEVKFEDGHFLAVPIEDPQIDIFEIEKAK